MPLAPGAPPRSPARPLGALLTAALLFVLTLALVTLAWSALATPASAAVDDLDGEEREAIRILNQERTSRGLPVLVLSPILTEAAEWMSADLVRQGRLSHVDSQGRDLGPRVHSFGYPTNAWIRENIAMGYTSGADVMDGWMGSPGHRANNLASDVTAAGIARVQASGGTWFWTLVLGSHRDEGSVAVPGPTPAPTPPPVSGTPPVGSGPGTFAQEFPSAGVGLNSWNGGPVAQLAEGARQGGARSIWVTVDGVLVGYVLGAPAFVNAAFVSVFPAGDVPPDTGVLVAM